MSFALQALLVAYLLPSAVLLRQMAVQRSELLPASFAVEGTLTLLGDEARKGSQALGLASQDPLSVPAKLSFEPGRCTLEVRSTARQVSMSNDRGKVSGTEPGWAAWLVKLGCLPFLFRGEGTETQLQDLMRKSGSRFDEAALTLENGKVAYVLGAGEEGRGKFGMVVTKRGLVPVRVWEQVGTTEVDVGFAGYRPVFHEGGFPTRIELRTGGATVARFASP